MKSISSVLWLLIVFFTEVYAFRMVMTVQTKFAESIINTAFSVPFLFDYASNQAKKMIKERGSKIGVDWDENVSRLQAHLPDINTFYETIVSKDITYPDYYLKQFHAYKEGNLSWKAAMDVESAAYAVHSQVYSIDNPNDLDRLGDFRLRDFFHKCMIEMLSNHGVKATKIVDIGCSTGLSTIKLHTSFPDAQIFGIDLSPYMLAVAAYQLESDPEFSSARHKISYIHANGEDLPFKNGEVDLVTMSLISHELPETVSRKIFQSAFEVLPAGGAIVIMDLNPESQSFKKLASNPFAFAAFKSTEPWLQEYTDMDLQLALQRAGFQDVTMQENSPRHRTVIGYKV